jgi:hypothetical protein
VNLSLNFYLKRGNFIVLATINTFSNKKLYYEAVFFYSAEHLLIYYLNLATFILVFILMKKVTLLYADMSYTCLLLFY